MAKMLRTAVIGTGVGRYHVMGYEAHPQAEVVARYESAGARVMNSAGLGAISVEVLANGMHVESYRASHWGWWQQRPP